MTNYEWFTSLDPNTLACIFEDIDPIPYDEMLDWFKQEHDPIPFSGTQYHNEYIRLNDNLKLRWEAEHLSWFKKGTFSND